jgi:hypothetical protein
MSSVSPNTADLAGALDKIFGPRHGYRSGQRLPDLAELKKAFRRASLHRHPDRARALGLTEELLTREFQDINDAYRLLLPVIVPQKQRFTFAAAPAHSRPAEDFFWKLDRLPPVKLRFAQFLYYKGLVSFRTMIRAVVWQSERRPRVGELARQRVMLSREQISLVLKHKKLREPFLSAAVRIGFLSRATRLDLLAEQASYRIPIGRYFTEQGILTAADLRTLLAECARHNASIVS